MTNADIIEEAISGGVSTFPQLAHATRFRKPQIWGALMELEKNQRIHRVAYINQTYVWEVVGRLRGRA